MEGTTTAEHTIVVRVWHELHDDRPRSRLIVVESGEEITVRGVSEIVDAFDATLRRLVDRH